MPTDLIKLPDGSNAFITRATDNDVCPIGGKHVYDLTIYTLSNGVRIAKEDHLCPTNEATQEFIQNMIDKKYGYGVSIVSGCGGCVKCRQVWFDNNNINLIYG